ncbi:HET-domain-containing protein [Byssothecium circinans]|uniref:HET-domain-containing protein n=1 Tax=Byssothecium circinans TaxID=147558 RepID=A0A6A5UFF2_9PLEO|nr:HET-domain-containing protein [Byssothecium circinans]
MRLLQHDDNGGFSLVERVGNDIPHYAILSHTWGRDDEEFTFQDLMSDRGKGKPGYRKVRFCTERAARDGLQYSWVDTCCIDKSSSAELSEAINSMFRWYQNAERCYVYLSDVSRDPPDGDDLGSLRWKPAFRNSRWFTRGWTLQELIAPASVEFFSSEEVCLGNKTSMEQTIHEITGIATDAFRGKPLSQFSIDERFMWSEKRTTKRKEDEVYCLLGMFDIQMPLLYGEGRTKALRRLQKEIRECSNDRVLSLSGEQKRTLLDSLRFEQIDVRQMSIKNAHAKTCRWLLRKSEYLDWLDMMKLNEHHGFLWIKGKPGTGKSTLMKFAFANARKTTKDKIVISFFFNARGEDLEKSTIGTYKSLLLQLLERLPALQSVFDSLGLSTLSTSTNHQWSIESLKTLLEYAILSLGDSSVVCFIDALDECAEEQIRDMISFFERIGELAVSSGIHFQVCFSSRHYPHITIQKGLYLVLEGQEGHTQDITNYLESELRIGQSKIAQQIRSELQEKASGIFMWVVLVVGILNKEHDRGRIHALRQRLQEIPGDLHELFRDILTRDSHNRDELVLCIQWVLFAKQPLSPEQLYFAILSGVEPDAVSMWNPGDITRDVIRKFILNSSKGLTEITTSKLQKVQFIHESVRDFLLKEDGLSNIWSDLKSSLQGQSHERLKQCCLKYMSVDVFTPLKIPESLPKASSPQATDIRTSVDGAFPFLEYAANNVLYHANAAEGGGVAQAHFLESFPLPQWSRLNNLFEKREVRRHSAGVSLLYLLGEHNMPNLIGVHPHLISCLEVENERYGCPFFAAMATGSKEAIQALLKGLVVKQPLKDEPCEENSHEYYEECSQKNIGRDFTFSKRRTILSYSAEFGYKRIVPLLLETDKVDIDSKDQNGRTPLSWAAQNRHETVVKLLLDTGKVDVDSKDQNGRTPLWWAVQNRHETVVKLLLDTGKVDVNLIRTDGRRYGGRHRMDTRRWSSCCSRTQTFLNKLHLDLTSSPSTTYRYALLICFLAGHLMNTS